MDFPANSLDDDVEIYENEDRENVITVFHTLRQQENKSLNLALADYIAQKQLE
ncbi:MAG: hypothetical protein H6613_04335 [Ignavibacteriales bacterium]|nr:hypothetical protein [Ignavibacteriales bacterium]